MIYSRNWIEFRDFIEKDGDQVLELCFIDLDEAVERMVGQSKYRGKLYFQFEPQYRDIDSESRHGPTKRQRVFDRANSGRLFEAAQAADPDSSPLIAILAFKKLYSDQTQGYHPIYGNIIMHSE